MPLITTPTPGEFISGLNLARLMAEPFSVMPPLPFIGGFADVMSMYEYESASGSNFIDLNLIEKTASGGMSPRRISVPFFLITNKRKVSLLSAKPSRAHSSSLKIRTISACVKLNF